jgi:hypothetical protein
VIAMIDEVRTLKAMVSELAAFSARVRTGHDAEVREVGEQLYGILTRYRDDPFTCEDGGSTKLLGFTTAPNWGDTGRTITIAPRPSQADRDAAQTVAWKQLFDSAG